MMTGTVKVALSPVPSFANGNGGVVSDASGASLTRLLLAVYDYL
ncbi:MAG: hypothetical protein ABSC32_19250 [Steroidobacteraceae bacterium]|jgi:hypothetical protein